MLFTWRGMQSSGKLTDAHLEDNEIAIRFIGFIICMWNSSWDKHSYPSRVVYYSIAKLKSECPLKNMPCLIIGVVDVNVVRSTSAPLINTECLPNHRYRRLIVCPH